eukprot:Rhum_TRINITY_DN15415_c1_g1::Rhum_TRINITY_DN15415_c1_g1_i4::g.155530::m.155530
MRHLLLLATLCCLCLQVVQGDEAKTPLHVEPFDDAYEPAHIAMMATSFSVAGVLILVVLGSLVVRGKASLANMLLVMVFAAVIVVGMVSWIITYVEMRDEMQEKVQSLIILAGDGVDVSILRTLESGVTIGKMYERMRAFEVTSMNDTFPAPVPVLHALRQSFVGKDAAISSLYYGSKWGYTMGGGPVKDQPELFSGYLGYPGTAPRSIVQGFNCRGWDLDNAGCATVDCSTSAGVNCGATCLIYNSTNCFSKDVGSSRIIYFNTPWGKVVPPATTENTWAYEPRGRPWYIDGMAADGEPVWTAPYAFAVSDSEIPQIGFSYEFAVKHPTTGEAEGVFAVDYTLGSLHQVLLGLIPTKHSSILMSDLSGNLFASSTFASDVATIKIAPDGKKSYEVANVFTHSRAEIRDVFHDIRRVVGSLNEASQLRRLIQLSDSTLLVSPLNMTGLYLLIVVEVPHKDILEAVNDASTLSLAVVLIISVVLAGLVSGLIYVLASKLERLSQDMHDVAWMKVEDTNIEANSIVSEIHSMQESFALLVKNMMEYRQFLPQTLLADEPDEDSAESAQGSEKSRSRSTRLSSRETPTSPTKQRDVFDTALSGRNISVVCLNWCGTHARLCEACGDGAVASFTSAFSAYLEGALASAKQTRGVIDHFSGDRICVMFNAATSASGHTRRAVDCATLVKNAQTGRAVAGVATGHGMCGNAGCHGLKKYCAFGRVVSSAHALVRLAGNLDEEIVTEDSAVEAISHFFTLKWLRRVQIRHDAKPILACAVKSAISGKKQEWMYELAAAVNPYADYNVAVTEMLDGNCTAAMQSVENLCEKATLVPEAEVDALKVRILACAAGAAEEPLAL